ncbi:hypothetical protein DPMN_034173 [Dreissena polymorpha]|uniref:Uncharacterized protein n=1 Tax=Dreissena polymorpha TaxID=45954 RepID=A0A9D4M715_DREPO|nr:hypothetical protein DPMN_034173 [Dreissena polymorpha]
MVEKTAYRGQQSVYMGIVTQMYMQQALAMLMDMVTDKPDIEKKVNDIFALSTRSLDQFGRAGAFFHIIRRQVTMSETSLYELDDSRTISNLPLRGDGVFGEEMEKTLKQKKDKRKHLKSYCRKNCKRRKHLRGKPVTRQNNKHLSKDNMLRQIQEWVFSQMNTTVRHLHFAFQNTMRNHEVLFERSTDLVAREVGAAIQPITDQGLQCPSL